ncbi:molluscan insulin-related peptide 7-like isoform X2 [Babylonia areolata]|uniref:molluscan insulin-related peptide 7-like isoform X2 n=1 Tax=Babylonia areolata TaxID=304850 RepID=UPI003FD42040
MLRTICQRIAMKKVAPVLLALLLCLLATPTCQGTFCGVDSRPHPKGICGSKLLRAHRNLCFLLSTDYPNIFNGPSHKKRSLKTIDDIPVHAFAEMDLQDVDDQLTGNSGTGSRLDTESMRKLFLSLFPRLQALLPGMGPSPSSSSSSISSSSSSSLRGQMTPGPMTRRMQAKRAEDILPRVTKRGMVCDCCYNVCQASTLAQYCP